MTDTINETAKRIVGQEVRYCVSSLISTLIRGAFEPGAIMDEDDAMRLSSREPDADDYRDAVPHGECITVLERDDDGEPGSGQWEWFGPNSDSVFTDDGGDYPESELEAWESAFEANGWDRPDGSEVFEYWLVTDWLAAKLKARGECVADDVEGLTVWGRCTTGQAIYMDHVIQEIAREIERA